MYDVFMFFVDVFLKLVLLILGKVYALYITMYHHRDVLSYCVLYMSRVMPVYVVYLYLTIRVHLSCDIQDVLCISKHKKVK
mgnify:CR=1 FL=1